MKKFFLLLSGLFIAANAVAAIPADPTNVLWYDCGDETGFSRLMYSLPQVDTEGNPLVLENMAYRIYTDNDQLFTFDDAIYSYDDLYGNQTDIYYWIFSEGVDFHPNYTYFYRTNAEGYEPFFTWRIGIQVVYINEDNSKTYSNIVYDEVFPHEGMPGDVNGDNEVSISDVTILIDYLLNANIAINEANADLDGDSNISIADVTALIDMLLSGAE